MASPLKYDGGLTCSLGVTDLKKSIAWYQDTLGFQLLYHVEEMGWCELATEIPRVNVGLSQVEKVTKGGGTTLTFGVEDIEHSRKQLEAKKVKFDGPIRTYEGMVRLATFFDPDGNTFMFFQDLQKK
jgi:catechol 2,3-dioxygenase-like lactoylglutathione lyase family enzyme